MPSTDVRHYGRSISQRAILISGATNEWGRAIAEGAALRGANLALVGRDQSSLLAVAEAQRRLGAIVVTIVADPDVPSEVDHAGACAIRAFGGLDAWINVSNDGPDGVRTWCETAIKVLSVRGGTLINVGNEFAGYTSDLRNDVASDRLPVAVCSVRSDGVSAAKVVAHETLGCVGHPQRDVRVGRRSRLRSAFDELRSVTWMPRPRRRRLPPAPKRDELRLVARGHVRRPKQDLYTSLTRRPWATVALAGVATLIFGHRAAHAPTIKGSRVNP